MSKTGLAFAGVFVFVAAYFIFTQGLFGESFIALILGLPWVLVPSFFEFFGLEGDIAMMFFTLFPVVINIAIAYWIGSLVGKMSSRRSSSQ